MSSYKLSDIVYEDGDYWVLLNKDKSFYEVYKSGITHSTRCATISYTYGIDRVKTHIEYLKGSKK